MAEWPKMKWNKENGHCSIRQTECDTPITCLPQYLERDCKCVEKTNKRQCIMGNVNEFNMWNSEEESCEVRPTCIEGEKWNFDD